MDEASITLQLIKIRFKINRMKKKVSGTSMQWMAASDTEKIYLFNVFHRSPIIYLLETPDV